MKKSFLLILTSLLLVFGLTSCGGGEEPKPNPEPTPPVVDPTPDVKPPVTEPTEDYTVKTEGNAGAFNEASYVISVVDPTDSSYSSFEDESLEITIDRTNWSYVTALNESETKILSKNEQVVPADAIKVELITMTSQHDDNTIKGIKLVIDRTKIKVGETFIKVHFDPSNGSSSADNIDLCVPLKVVEYGSITNDTTEVTFKLNINNVDNSVLNNNLVFVVSDNNYKYGSSSPRFTEYQVSTFTDEIKVNLVLEHELSIFMRYEVDGKTKWIEIDLITDNTVILVNGNYIFTKPITSSIEVKNR